MHELSVCLSLLEQVHSIAREQGATRVERIVLRIGPLSGVEAALLRQAYPLAAAGGPAEDAELVLEPAPVLVHCPSCDRESAAEPNRLICGHCGDWRTRLVSGDEMLLVRVELSVPEATNSPTPDAGQGEHPEQC